MTADASNLDDVWDALSEVRVPLFARMALQDALKNGAMRASVARKDGATAVLVFSPLQRWRQVELGFGEEALLLPLLTALRDEADGVVWDDDSDVVRVAADALTNSGFLRVVRQEYLQDLSRVPMTPPVIEGFEVGPLDAEAIARSRALYVETHFADAATALYTTWPEPPTREALGAAFDKATGGSQGRLVPEASFSVRSGAEIVGLVFCAESTTPGEATLLDLAVSGSTQGRGLSRLLVRSAQRGLKVAGFERMRFYTTGSNLPVLKLFTAEEIVESTSFHSRLWRREAHG